MENNCTFNFFKDNSCFNTFMSDENMAELLPLFYWVHIDAPGQVSHSYTKRERERHTRKYTIHAHTHMYMHILIASLCTITCTLFRK